MMFATAMAVANIIAKIIKNRNTAPPFESAVFSYGNTA